jgi:hypothetical protein
LKSLKILSHCPSSKTQRPYTVWPLPTFPASSELPPHIYLIPDAFSSLNLTKVFSTPAVPSSWPSPPPAPATIHHSDFTRTHLLQAVLQLTFPYCIPFPLIILSPWQSIMIYVKSASPLECELQESRGWTSPVHRSVLEPSTEHSIQQILNKLLWK